LEPPPAPDKRLEGTLWGKPDWADPAFDKPGTSGAPGRRNPPGTVYKYNDVRVNALALAALNVWRRPLPQVAGKPSWIPSAPPIPGAGSDTRIRGRLDGAVVQSVSGGGTGRGLFIDAYDLARFGYLTIALRTLEGPQLISRQWVE